MTTLTDSDFYLSPYASWPWRWQYEGDSHATIVGRHARHPSPRKASYENPVAKVQGFSPEETKRVAALMTAAPEMASALQQFLIQFQDFKRWPQGKGYSMSSEALAVYEQAEDALLKAGLKP